MMVASYAVNEFLNRIHEFKVAPAREYAQSTIDLTEGCFIHQSEGCFQEDDFLRAKAGCGDRKVFLDAIEISKIENQKVA